MFEYGNRDIFRVHPGVGATADGGRSMGDIGRDSGGIDEVWEVGMSIGRIGFVCSELDEVDEFTQHSKLQFQLDTVHHAFEHGLHDVQVLVLQGEKAHVHEDNDQINREKLVHDFARSSVGVQTEQFGRFPDIQPRNDELLNTEHSHLDLFHNVIPLDVWLRSLTVRSKVGSVGQDSGGNMQNDSVDDNHTEDAFEDAVASENEM